jgi:cytochrome c-type biogenesis protein
MTDVSLPAAGLAGILSFLSPCVLPLVPPYLCFLAGTTIEDLAASGERRAQRDVLLAGLLFVAGFSTVFVLLGATASVLGQVIRQYLDVLSILAGIAITLMGLHFLGLFRLGFLYREARLRVEKPVGLWGA